MLKVRMKEGLLWLFAHLKPHLTTLQQIKRWPLKGTKINIYATIARNLAIGLETGRKRYWT